MVIVTIGRRWSAGGLISHAPERLPRDFLAVRHNNRPTAYKSKGKIRCGHLAYSPAPGVAESCSPDFSEPRLPAGRT